MSYVVFARKYRPQTFDDIAGQSHVTTTLKNAISSGRVAHSYLFAGPRGVGKTTTARLLAKALNCDKGPTATPCNSCASCKEISGGSSMDILEIDGASNRGIDEIRNLRDNVKFAPSRGRFKIYIIDEVHMLTQEAFNALLKTLEEPPAHVKFIFATTMAYKVPATIISRCQRFDFRRIASSVILKNLKEIVKSEKLNVNEEALALVAKYADGAMRDGQVLLDQIVSYSKGPVGADDVTKMLGLVSEDLLFEMSDKIKAKDASGALGMISDIVNEGKDVFQVVLGLLAHFRNMAVAKISKDLDSMIESGPEKVKRYKEDAGKFTIEEILYIVYTLANTIDFIKKSGLSRVPLEAAVIKLTRARSIESLEDILAKIDKIETGGARQALQAEAPRSVSAPVKSHKPEDKRPENKHIDPKTPAQDSQLSGDPKLSGDTQVSNFNSTDLDEISAAWSGVVNHIRMKKISIASFLQEGDPVAIEGNKITVGFPKECKLHMEVLTDPGNKKMIELAVKAKLNMDVKIDFKLIEPAARPVKDGGVYDEDVSPEDGSSQKRAAAKDTDPIVNTAIEMFGGEISEDQKLKRKPR